MSRRILLVIYSLNRGGAERTVCRLSEGFKKAGHEVTIIVFKKIISYPYEGTLIDLSCPSKSTSVGKIYILFKRYLSLKNHFKNNHYDLIIGFMESSNIPLCLANSNAILSVRNNPHSFPKIYQLLIKKLYKSANYVTCPSMGIEKALNTSFKLTNTRTILNPFISKRQSHPPQNKPHRSFILGVGRLAKQKNFKYLISVFYRTNLYKTYDLVICGEGPLRSELTNQINTLRIEKQVILKGDVDNIRWFFEQCHFFVLSSLHEGLPCTLIEAMCYGTAVISTRCPFGPEELIQHEKTGLLTKDATGTDLGELMLKYHRDETLRIAMKKNATSLRKRVNIQSIAKQWLELT